MISKETISTQVEDIIVKHFGVTEITIKSNTLLFNDCGFDSLDFVELVMEVEKLYSIGIPDEEAWQLLNNLQVTFEEFINLVYKIVNRQ